MPVRQDLGGNHILNRLVAELQILLNRYRVLDLEPDNGRSTDKRTSKESPLCWTGLACHRLERAEMGPRMGP